MIENNINNLIILVVLKEYENSLKPILSTTTENGSNMLKGVVYWKRTNTSDEE